MGKHSQKVSKSKKKVKINKNKIIRLIIILAIILIIILKITQKEETNQNDEISLIINNQNVTSELENDIIERDGIIYISFNDVKKLLDNTIYQEESGLIITSSNKKVAALKLDNRDIEINGSEIEINGQAFKNQDGVIFIPISELEKVYDIEFNYIENTKIITIDYYSKSLEKAYATKNISVKSEMSRFSTTISEVKKGDWVIYISSDPDTRESKWAKVRTQDGNIGYVKRKKLTDFVTERDDIEETSTENIEDYLEKNITKENIETYEKRKDLIDEILQDTVEGEKRAVKIIYEKDNTSEEFTRFKIEVEPILRECGITVIFE